MTLHKHVIVIGAGISGLTAAYRLKTLGVDVIVVESSSSSGGVIRSDFIDDYLVERGPNTVQATPDFLNLVEELGISGMLLESDPKAPAYIYFKGSLHRVPRGPGAMLRTDLLSLSAKLGLLAEPFRLRRRSDAEESVASFFSRRLGGQIAERFVAPFMSGIYAGDPNRLSIQAAFPMLSRLEQDHGSLVLGAIGQMRKAGKVRRANQTNRTNNARGERAASPLGSAVAPKPRRGRRTCSFRSGMQCLPERLASYLDQDLVFNSTVLGISEYPAPPASEGDPRFVVRVATSRGEERITCSTVVVATTAFAASRLVAPLSEELGRLLAEIEYPPLVIVNLAYNKAEINASLDGFGFLAVPGEGLNVLGCVFNSSLFEDRAPAGKALLTCFVGGARNPILARRQDSDITDLVHADLKKVLGINGEPRVVALTRYDRSIPQYNLGHAERTRKIDSIVDGIKGLKLIGNYLHGVSTGDCIKEAEQTAKKIALKSEFLTPHSTSRTSVSG
ncbi:MAG TPA: protoporphyrinogen oxidase [Blastocatellia bacterium]